MQPRVLLALFPLLLLAEKAVTVQVQVIDRRDSETEYSYTAPAVASSASNSNATCVVNGQYVNCAASGTASTVAVPARRISYEVRGATYSLRLPDNRVVVVNCESKYQMRADYINRRSCRMPLVDSFRAEFKGDKAKLIWPVSIDGKKTQSETYKIIAINEAPPKEE